MTHSMIVHANISKSFKDPVLDQAEFALEEGLIHGLVGRNGTGKTTLMSILAGQQKCAGELQVFGQNPWDNKATMDRTVFTGVDTPYPPLWNLGGILDVAAKRYPNWDSATADRLVSAFNLPLDTRFDRASRGERSMLAIVVALAARAELTLLDEPYVGLDVQNRTFSTASSWPLRKPIRARGCWPRTIWKSRPSSSTASWCCATAAFRSIHPKISKMLMSSSTTPPNSLTLP